jgi:hypothetical protein
MTNYCQRCGRAVQSRTERKDGIVGSDTAIRGTRLLYSICKREVARTKVGRNDPFRLGNFEI